MTTVSALLLQSDGAPGGAVALGSTVMIVGLAIAVVFIAALWKVFTKAGQPGWAVLIPIYNTIVMLKIAGRPVWWFVLLLVPLVNIVILFIVAIDIAKAFGKSAA